MSDQIPICELPCILDLASGVTDHSYCLSDNIKPRADEMSVRVARYEAAVCSRQKVNLHHGRETVNDRCCP